MDPTLVPGTHFESQFQICVYEHAILRIYISFFPTIGIRAKSDNELWMFICMNPNNLCCILILWICFGIKRFVIILSETLLWTWPKPSLFFLRSTHSG